MSMPVTTLSHFGQGLGLFEIRMLYVHSTNVNIHISMYHHVHTYQDVATNIQSISLCPLLFCPLGINRYKACTHIFARRVRMTAVGYARNCFSGAALAFSTPSLDIDWHIKCPLQHSSCKVQGPARWNSAGFTYSGVAWNMMLHACSKA